MRRTQMTSTRLEERAILDDVEGLVHKFMDTVERWDATEAAKRGPLALQDFLNNESCLTNLDPQYRDLIRKNSLTFAKVAGMLLRFP